MSARGITRFLIAGLFSCQSMPGQHWFDAPRIFPEGRITAVADLDGDGDRDLVRVMASGSSAVAFTAMLNPGNGDFADLPAIPLPLGTGLVAAVGDVTGGGVPDLVISTLSSYAFGTGFLVYPGTGSGGFGPAVHRAVPAGTVKALHLADVNGDGTRDVGAWLAVAAGGRFDWHLASGGGSFTALPGVTLPAAQLNPNFASLALDTNGDGTTDIAVAGIAGLITCPTTGGGTIVGPTIPTATAAQQDAFATGDLDGDGDLDVIYAGSSPTPGQPQPTTSFVRILNLGGGNWSAPLLQTPSPYDFYQASTRLVTGDWNGDGTPDVGVTMTALTTLGVPTLGRIKVYAGSPSGSYVLNSLIVTWEIDPAVVALADVSGDGFLDFVGASQVYFGDGSFPFPFNFGLGAVTVDQPRDLDDDGDVDFPAGFGYSNNDGTGFCTSLYLPHPPPPPGASFSPLIIGDFNGDLRPDWLVSTYVPAPFPSPPTFLNHRILADAGNGTLADLGPASTTPMPLVPGNGNRWLAADVNGDGFDDVLAPTAVWTSNGTGAISAGTPAYPGMVPFTTGDVDHDGDVDFVVASTGWTPPPAVVLFRNLGGGVFMQALLDTYPATLATARLVDLDDDGDLDALLAYSGGSAPMTVRIVENVNNGSLLVHTLPAPALPLPGTANSHPIVTADAGDFDQDGKTDVVVGFAGDCCGGSISPLAILKRTGPGFAYEPARIFGCTTQIARAVDLDGDGDPDLTGITSLLNRHYLGAAAGRGRQYGTGAPGLGGIVPILGRSGPLRTGQFAAIRARRGLGGGSGILVIGSAQSAIGYPGVTSYAEPWISTAPIVLQGSPGLAGAGTLDLGTIVPPGLTGTTFYLQVGLFDLGVPVGISATNGLELQFGL